MISTTVHATNNLVEGDTVSRGSMEELEVVTTILTVIAHPSKHGIVDRVVGPSGHGCCRPARPSSPTGHHAERGRRLYERMESLRVQ